MKNTGIRIYKTGKEILSTILEIVELYGNSLNWKLLFLGGTYINEGTFELEGQVNDSVYGIPTDLSQIKEVIGNVDDLQELLLLGQFKKVFIVRKDEADSTLFDSSDIVIEYFDSSYWTITSNNIDFIEGLRKKFETSYRIEYPFLF